MGTESDNEDYETPANWLRAARLDALEPPQTLEVHRLRQLEAGPSRRTDTSSEVRLPLCWPESWLGTHSSGAAFKRRLCVDLIRNLK